MLWWIEILDQIMILFQVVEVLAMFVIWWDLSDGQEDMEEDMDEMREHIDEMRNGGQRR